MLRTAEPSTPASKTAPEPGAEHRPPAVSGHAVNGHAVNGHGDANGAGCCPPPLEAAWLERVETSPLRRTPDDVEPSDVLPSPCGEGS